MSSNIFHNPFYKFYKQTKISYTKRNLSSYLYIIIPRKEGQRLGVEQLLSKIKNDFAKKVLEKNRDLFGDDPDKLQAITRLAEQINEDKPDQKLGFRYLNDFLSCLRKILEIRGEGAKLSAQEITMFSQFYQSRMAPDTSPVGYTLDTTAIDTFIQKLASYETGRTTNTEPVAEIPPEPIEDPPQKTGPTLMSLDEATAELNQPSETPKAKTEQPDSSPPKTPESPSEHQRRIDLLRRIREDFGRE